MRKRKIDKAQQRRGRKGGQARFEQIGREGMRKMVRKRWAKAG